MQKVALSSEDPAGEFVLTGVPEPDCSGISDGTFPEWFVRGGVEEPVRIEVQLTPHTNLKLEPAREPGTE